MSRLSILVCALASGFIHPAAGDITAYIDDVNGNVSDVTVDGTNYDTSTLINGTLTAFSDTGTAQLIVGDGGSVPATGSRAGLLSDLSLSTGTLNISGAITFTFNSAVTNRTGTDLLIWDWGGFSNDTFDITINGTTFSGAGDTNSGSGYTMNLPTGASYVQGPGRESDWFASTTDPVGSLASLESAAFSATRNISITSLHGVIGIDLDAFGVAAGSSITTLTISAGGGTGTVDPTLILGLVEPPPPTVAFFRFDDSPGFLVDSEGNHDLSAGAGTVSQVTTTPSTGKAAVFDGSASLQAADSDDWTNPAFTIEAYVIPDTDFSAGSTGVIAGHIESGAGDERSWYLGIRDGTLRLYLSTDGASGIFFDRFSLAAGTPYYCAASVDVAGQQAVLYLEDLGTNQSWREEVALTESSLFNATANFSIGATDTPSSFFDGTIDDVRLSRVALSGAGLLRPQSDTPVISTKADGYKGIWFELPQYLEYGPKYSGGLGTYTAKHVPLSIYAPEVDKTFFVYGGTTAADERRLLAMVSEYDHATHTVPKPTILLDKTAELGSTVNDPHDNPALAIDDSGYLWIFVSGRAGLRQDWMFKSTQPYSADSFQLAEAPSGDERAYPQIFHIPGSGFMHLFTIYQPGRELFVRTSADGLTWNPNTQLADMEGHYQVSWRTGNKVGTMFNRHPGRVVDERTDLFYLQTTDFGATWTTVDGTPVTLPITSQTSPCSVFDYSGANKLVYLNDLNFDKDGNPVLFYTTASNAGGDAHAPGPFAEPRMWVISHWDGTQWNHREMPASATATSTVTHNYDTGSIHIEGDLWRVIGPSGAPSIDPEVNPERYWGQGGEVEVWESTDQGVTWTKVHETTRNSARNHGYVRRTFSAADRFTTFWADGNPDTLTESHLYFGNKEGTRYWELPYNMTTATATPVEVDPPYGRWLELHFSPPEITAGTITGPDDDPDEDGRSNVQEYGDGTDPRKADGPAKLDVGFLNVSGELYPTLDVETYRFAFDLQHRYEYSTDLDEWLEADPDLELLSTSESGGLLLQTYRDTAAPLGGGENTTRFYRRITETAQ